MKKRNTVDWIALILLIIGGLNWLLVGALKFDLVQSILGSIPVLRDIVYILVGLSAIWAIVRIEKI
ncbi:MAG: DUF378 domain-containing protein [archaeon]|jgi:uncharacterized membrane protein YuzA (DUF378 family)|nr:DUF378 domain-containing protein [archaeon]MDD2477629.1 DUF378 domain-containing protein [Candidatus ainarchaeum sp.]MDD3084276.1 DUF378 domain-containing protein [Candidatus ainarchaeum sp.]MDD4221017.1 DUF378 domain-containing protein [Candidatus ainarchaeum sp.]MDD4662489.1 DUF378 domain-containing protein [Candidatus ainarchaeum sp.]